MEIAKHTPGPWIFIKQFNKRTIYPYVNGGCGMKRIGFAHSDADARLMSLAPEMLDALKEIYNHSGFISIPSAVWGKVERAIKKAEGRES